MKTQNLKFITLQIVAMLFGATTIIAQKSDPNFEYDLGGSI